MTPDTFRRKLAVIESADLDKFDKARELNLLDREARRELHEARRTHSNYFIDFWRGNCRLVQDAKAKIVKPRGITV